MAHDIQEAVGAPVIHMALSLQTEYILHAPRYCCSILPLHTYVGVVDGKKHEGMPRVSRGNSTPALQKC